MPDYMDDNSINQNKKNSLISLENSSGKGFVLKIGKKSVLKNNDDQMSLSLENLKEEFHVGGGDAGFTPQKDTEFDDFKPKKGNMVNFGGFKPKGRVFIKEIFMWLIYYMFYIKICFVPKKFKYSKKLFFFSL